MEGVRGAVTQPLRGAAAGGAGGFVRGLGQGAVGLLVRPVGGLVDFTSGLLATVRRFLLADVLDSICICLVSFRIIISSNLTYFRSNDNYRYIYIGYYILNIYYVLTYIVKIRLLP